METKLFFVSCSKMLRKQHKVKLLYEVESFCTSLNLNIVADCSLKTHFVQQSPDLSKWIALNFSLKNLDPQKNINCFLSMNKNASN